jgi:hypothetical protein
MCIYIYTQNPVSIHITIYWNIYCLHIYIIINIYICTLYRYRYIIKYIYTHVHIIYPQCAIRL